jgi:hypothetical protein
MAVDETVMAGKLIGGGRAQIVIGAKAFGVSREIGAGYPSFDSGRSKVIVVGVMGVCGRKVADIDAAGCGSRR